MLCFFQTCFSVSAFLRFISSFRRPVKVRLDALAACLILTLMGPAAFALTPPAYPGTTTTLPGGYGATTAQAKNSWDVEGPNVSGTPSGWNVSYNVHGHALTITVPANLPSANYGSYSASYCTGWQGSPDTGYAVGYSTSFTVTAAPPTKPAAGMPAFSWQGSVAGVNTGNGNKTTTLPLVGWTMRGGRSVSCALIHNSQGGLNSGYGNKWQASYFSYLTADGSGNETVHWDNGLSYTFTKSGTLYTSPNGIFDTLTAGTGGAFTLTTYDQTKYVFGFVSGNAYLSAITDLDGNTLTINHYPSTLISSLVDATGRTVTYGYDGTGRLSTVKDPLSRVWTFTYDGSAGSGNLWYVTLPPLSGSNYSESFGYDNNHNITAQQSPQGRTATFAYNPDSSLAWAKDPMGNQTTFTYNAATTVITDPNGHATTHTYNASQLVSVTDALGKTASTIYDNTNIASSMTDKRGKTSSYSSHLSNNTAAPGSPTNGVPTSYSTDPLGFTSSSVIDPAQANKTVSSADALGNTTTYAYSTDGHFDLSSTQVTATGPSSSFQASSSMGGYTNGLPSTVTDPNGHSSTLTYDGNGYVSSLTDANQNPTSTVSNVLGRTMTSTDANSHTVTYTYDNWGRITDIQAPDNTHTKTTYDQDGNVLTVTDANTHTVTNVYDADERLIQTTNGRGDVVKYTYDGTDSVSGASQKGLLSSKTDGNNHVTRYRYTVRDEPWITLYADGTAEGLGYDENGNVTARSKADGNVINYTYDDDSRLTDITYPHLHATHFDYDADGRRVDMTDATGKTTWTYGDGLHLTQTVTPYGGTSTQTVGYGYDLAGERLIMSLAGLGSWSYSYDPAGNLLTLKNPYNETTTLAYDAANRLIKKTKGNSSYETYAYDVADQMTGIGYYAAGGTLANSLTYTYDPAGNILTRNEGSRTITYGYDGDDQQTSEVATGSGPYNYGYTYDHNGNRLTQTQGGSTYQSFTYDAHDKLSTGTLGNETDGYDLNGNETSVSINGGTYTFGYDDEDRLTSIALPGSITDSFLYNGLGLRAAKQDSTGTYAYVCDGTSPGSSVLADGYAVYTPGLSERRGSTSSFYSNDQQGNLWTLNTASGAQTYTADMTGFGWYTANSGSSGTPFKFGGGNGCQTDADTGLVLMGHRYFDTRIGRFITQDPAGDGDNWYAYAGNSPTNAIDPDGLDIINITVAAHGSYTGFYSPDGYTSTQGSPVVFVINNTDQAITTTIDTSYSSTQVFNSNGTSSSIGGVGAGGGSGLNYNGSLDGGPGQTTRMLDGLLTGGFDTKAAEAAQQGDYKTAAGFFVAGTAMMFMTLKGEPAGESTEELVRLTKLWHEADRGSSAANLAVHYARHGAEVGADSLLQYARKAEGYLPQAKRGASSWSVDGATEGVTRYTKAGRYMDLHDDGRIISFGIR